MEKEDLKYDEVLKKLIQCSPLDSPSDGFVERVMGKIQENTIPVAIKQPFYVHLKSIFPFVLLGAFCLIIFFTSDFPFLNQFPGKSTFSDSILPYITMILTSFQTIFSTKYFSYAFMIVVAGLLLFLIEKVFSHRAAQNRMV